MSDAVPLQSATEPLETLLREVPFFRACDRVDAARLVGALEQVEVAAGALIFPEGEPADGLYLLERGRVAVTIAATDGDHTLAELEAPAHFGDLGLLLARRTAAARALTDARLWKLPRQRFEQLARERPSVALSVAVGAVELLERNRRELLGAPAPAPGGTPPLLARVPPRQRSLRWRLVGAVLAVGMPLILWPLPPPAGLDAGGWHVLLILLGATLGWLFEPLPDFAVALLMAAAWGVAGLASPTLAFAGFASSTWIVVLGAFALAVAVASSGLPLRATLFLLRTFPATHAGQVLALLLGGVLVTPLLPGPFSRVAAVLPVVRELAQVLGYPPRSRAGAALGLSGLIGFGLFSTVFLTGAVANLFVLGLVPEAARVRFDWLSWLVAAAPAGAVLLAGAIGILLLLFRPEVRPRVTAEGVRRQARVLGPPARAEWVTLAAVGVLVGGLLLQPLLRVDAAWLAVGALTLLVAGGSLDRERFRAALDWGLLVFLGVLLGAAGVLQEYGVDRWIAQTLIPVARAVGDPGLLVVLLGAFVVLVRLVVPWVPTMLLLSLALVPAAPLVGLSPWVVGFVVLTLSANWVFPAQTEFYRLVRGAAGEDLLTERQMLVAGIGLNAVTLLAIAASIPYWRAIGLLGG